MSLSPPIGHESALALLRRAAALGRLGQAYLFVGPSGIGKRRVARHLLQGLFCQRNDPKALDPCGECVSCRHFLAGTHPDVVEVSKPPEKNEFPIAVMQDLCKALSLTPSVGTRRAAIVDDVEFFNDESANSFLKTLEEPPQGSLLILITSDEESVLATIRSRCQLIRFRPLAESEVVAVLKRVKPEIATPDAERLASLAEGSAGLALELASPEWQEARKMLIAHLAAGPAPGFEIAKELQKFVDAAGKDSAPKSKRGRDAVEDDEDEVQGTAGARKRRRARDVVRIAASFVREALVCREIGVRPESPLEREPVERLARRLASPALVDLLERCLQADAHLGRYLGIPLTMECWLDDLAQIGAGRYVPPVGARW
ncbi:MAG TPA: DNA polymerase III subunit [Planctomycetia bacterium]|nr:DNA polymerase III subunit [Planctomycetia bacterium]